MARAGGKSGKRFAVEAGDERKPAARPRPAGAIVHAMIARTGQVRARFGVRLRLDWPLVVGTELARWTRPERLLPGRDGEPGVLHVAVAPAFALELQHRAPHLIERVNTHFGQRLVGNIAIRQRDLAASTARVPRAPLVDLPEPSPADAGRVTDPDLSTALSRLGAAVRASHRRDTRESDPD